jgi:hypothetical protein
MTWRARLLRLLPLALLTGAIVAVPVLSVSPSGLPWLQRLRADRDVAEAEVEGLTHEIARLRTRANALKTDLSVVEAVARDKQGLVRPNEVVFVFSKPSP